MLHRVPSKRSQSDGTSTAAYEPGPIQPTRPLRQRPPSARATTASQTRVFAASGRRPCISCCCYTATQVRRDRVGYMQDRGRCPTVRKGEKPSMYIGLGTVVLIVIIVLVVMALRRG